MPITDQDKKMLFDLYNIEGIYGYKELAVILKVSTKTIATLYGKEFREERLKVAEIKNIWLRKEMKPHISFKDFYDWYLAQDRKCSYCGITEEKLEKLLGSKKVETERLRGKKLELDRKDPKRKLYDDLNNFALACYWCNNAKTDTFTSEEFKKVGKVFRKIWEKRSLEKKILFKFPKFSKSSALEIEKRSE